MYTRVLFTDDKGDVQVKRCVLKKSLDYHGYGLLLRYQNGLHLIDQVEEASPAYNAGLREDDIILYADNKNVEQMSHDDVKTLIRALSQSNTPIDLLLMKKQMIPRYKTYNEKNNIDWTAVLPNNAANETSIKSRQNTRRQKLFGN